MLDKEKADTLGSPDGASVFERGTGHESHLSFLQPSAVFLQLVV
jgi:hypothetical protein